ncbi:MAG: nucleoside monophosphate kinase [Candidatus Saccharimonas sp.]
MIDTSLTKKQLEIIKKWLGNGSINIFGLPFSGKDTHGRILAELFDAPLMGGGDIFRNSVIPDHVREAINRGELAPTDDYIRIVLPYLSKKEFANRPLILSSVGRWSGEENGVLKATSASGHAIKSVIYLQLGEEMVYERWRKSQEIGDRADRVDDAVELLGTRVKEFTNKTLPVIDAYRKLGLLIEVNSKVPKQEAVDTILSRLLAAAVSKTR